MSRVKYIDDDINNGIEYDIRGLRRDFKSLHIPSKVFNPCILPMETNHYYVLLSERQIGKTTNLLLLGMLFNKRYGTIIHYIRQNSDMIRPMRLKDLFKTIVKCGYVKTITDGKYNNVLYDSKRWYYINVDDDGHIIDKAPEHFMFCCGVDENYNLKSSYNCPVGDFIIFDEFISNSYGVNEFVRFSDLVKTIINNRVCPYIFLVANTIQRHSMYFDELEIAKEIKTYDFDRLYTHRASGGTIVSTMFISSTDELKSLKSKSNKLFFGFKNPNMAAITGLNGGWADSYYKHLDCETVKHNETCLYFTITGDYFKIDELYDTEHDRYILYIHKATKTHSDSIILTLDKLDNNCIYGVSNDRLRAYLNYYMSRDLIYYQSNLCGSCFTDFINRYNNTKSIIK